MNSVIRRKLMEEEQPLRSIEQWYERTINLDKHQRESRREEERLRRKREMNIQVLKQTKTVNTQVLKINQCIITLAPVYIWTIFVLRPSLPRQLRFDSLIITCSIYLDYQSMFTSVMFHILKVSEIFTALYQVEFRCQIQFTPYCSRFTMVSQKSKWVSCVLSENVEYRSWNNLWLQLVCCIFINETGCIFQIRYIDMIVTESTGRWEMCYH